MNPDPRDHTAPDYDGPDEPPNAWWCVFDDALAYALDQGHSSEFAEDYATGRAERTYPGGRNADA